MADPKAKDVLGSLERRRTLADRIIDRVGFRAWKRPNVAMSSRIFRLYRLTDPFDPDSPIEEGNVGLGPVALRLGENKRQPAPHALPKEPKKPSTAPRPEQARSPTSAPAPSAPKPATPPPRPSAPADPPPIGPDGRPQLGYIPKDYGPKAAEQKKLHQPIRPQPPPKPAQPPPQPTPAKPSAKPPQPAQPAAQSRVQNPDKPQLGYIPKDYQGKTRQSSGAFSATQTKSQPKLFNTTERPGLVGKLPVRPDATLPAHVQQAMAAQQQAEAARAVATKQVTIPAAPAWRKPPMPSAPPVSSKGGSSGGSGGRTAGRVSLGAATVVVVESPELEITELPQPAPRAPAAAPSAPPPSRVVEVPRAVELSPAPRAVELSPAPRAVDPSPPPAVEAPRAAEPVAPKPAPKPAPSSLFDDELAAPPPPRPRPPAAPPGSLPRSNDGLDDLFAASLNEGRMRIGKAKTVTGTVSADVPDKPKKAPVALPKAVLPPGLPKPKEEP